MDDLYHNSMSSKDKRIWIKILNESLSAYIFRGYDVTDGSLWYMTVDRYSERGGWLGTKPHKVVGSHIFFKPTYYASKGG